MRMILDGIMMKILAVINAKNNNIDDDVDDMIL